LATKSTFLSEPEWKSVPFSVFPKAPLQKVLDLLLEAPMILKKVDRFPSLSREMQIPFLLDLLQDCVSIDRKMQLFILEFEASRGGLLYWPMPPKEPIVIDASDFPVSDDGVFPVSYEFSDSRIGITMMLYWGALTILYSGACHLYNTLAQLTTITPVMNGEVTCYFLTNEQNQTVEIPWSTRFRDFRTTANNVCQSVEFCLQDELSNPSMVAPLNMVIDALSSWPGFEKEIAWIRNTLVLISNKGMKMVKHVCNLED
jgi:hypothetical protein